MKRNYDTDGAELKTKPQKSKKIDWRSDAVTTIENIFQNSITKIGKGLKQFTTIEAKSQTWFQQIKGSNPIHDAFCGKLKSLSQVSLN